MLKEYNFPVYSRESKRAKRISALVMPDGIEVVLPQQSSLEEAEPLLDKHATWLQLKWQQLQQATAEHQSLANNWPIQLTLPLINAQLELSISMQAQSYYLDIKLTRQNQPEKQASFFIGKHLTSDYIVTITKLWLSDLAYETLLPLCDKHSKAMKLPYASLETHFRKSWWGTCSHDKQILLNSALLFFEAEYADYVITHECAHLRHMNHSKQFWQLVAKYCPNYAMIKKNLKGKALEIPLWFTDSNKLPLPTDINEE